ncbi:two-component sensor histidine kinase [Streptomyces pristinaespiralis]
MGAGLWRAAGACRPGRCRTRASGGSPLPHSTCPSRRPGTAVRDLLARQGVPVADDVVQGLLLIVSELVTNTVRHAALLSPEVAVEVAIGTHWVRVSVEDNHPYRPKALETDSAQTGGRGLLLVREITREAGGVCDVEHTASGGKIIWAELPLVPQFQDGAAPV